MTSKATTYGEGLDMTGCPELVLSTLPFIVRRKVRWSDCDPAGVVFTGRFSDYVLDAVGHFYEHIGYGPFSREKNADNVGLPTKSYSLAFHASLYPNDIFDLHLKVRKIKTHTFELLVEARLPDGKVAFDGHFAAICIRTDKRAITLVPEGLRAVLTEHLIEGREYA